MGTGQYVKNLPRLGEERGFSPKEWDSGSMKRRREEKDRQQERKNPEAQAIGHVTGED